MMREQSLRFNDYQFQDDSNPVTTMFGALKRKPSPERPTQESPSDVPLKEPNWWHDFAFSWRKLWTYMGPGFLISIAYIDPGNMDIDIRAGARFSHSLIWVVVLSMALGILLQYLSLKLGVITGRSLGEISQLQYRREVCLLLWGISEISLVCSDIPQVLGSAFALKLLFSLPLYVGVVISISSVLVLLFGEFFGMRRIEMLIGLLMGTMLVCIMVQFLTGEVSFGKIAAGFVPRVPKGSGFLIVAFVGSVVTPYNLYLHSSLVNTRQIEKSQESCDEAIFYNLTEFSIATFLCCLINLALISLSAEDFHAKGEYNVMLINAPKLIKAVLGGFAPYLFSLALLASSQSSIITSTLAGQYIMNEFVKYKLSQSSRALLTRCVAVIPSIVVVTIVDEMGADSLIVFTQAILSVLLPFPLISLVKFSSCRALMGRHANNKWTIVTSCMFGAMISVANLCVVWQVILNAIRQMGWAGKSATYLSLSAFTAGYLILILYMVMDKTNLGEKGVGETEWESNFNDGLFKEEESDVSVFESLLSECE